MDDATPIAVDPNERSSRPVIFREEALLFYARRGRRGDILRTTPKNTNRVFNICLAGFVLVCCFCLLIQVPTTRHGPALIVMRDPSHAAVLAFWPGNEVPRLKDVRSLQVSIDGYGEVKLDVDIYSIDRTVRGASELRTLYGKTQSLEGIVLPDRAVVIEGMLRVTSFVSGKDHYALTDGLVGTISINGPEYSLFNLLVKDRQ